MVLLVGRGEHLGLVDEVDLQRLEDLRLDEVPDTALGHDGNRYRLLDAPDHVRIRHARHAARSPDVGRNPLQRHHRDGAGLLGDPGVLLRHNIHYHAALEPLGVIKLLPAGSFVRVHLHPSSASRPNSERPASSHAPSAAISSDSAAMHAAESGIAPGRYMFLSSEKVSRQALQAQR